MNSTAQQAGNTGGTSSTNSGPSAIQAPYLQQAFSGASGALNTASTAQTPTNFTASYSPAAIQAYNDMLNSGTNTSVPASSAAAGSSLSTTGATGAATGVNNLTNFTNAGGTAANIANANQYVAGQNIPAQVAADMQGANQEANYVTNPGIDASAAAGGNTNSSRDAIEHGLVATNLAETAANTGAQLQANDYNTGLSLSEQNNEANNTNNLNADLGLTTGGGYDANAGTAANTGSVGQSGGLYSIAGAGATGQQAAAQAPLTNTQQAFTADTTDPYSALQNFYNIIGANNWGTTATGTTSGTSVQNSTPSTLSQLGGYINMAGSLV